LDYLLAKMSLLLVVLSLWIFLFCISCYVLNSVLWVHTVIIS